MTLGINDTQHNSTLPLRRVLCFICCYPECRYVKCRGAFQTWAYPLKKFTQVCVRMAHLTGLFMLSYARMTVSGNNS
jgi:hypothetical protein